MNCSIKSTLLFHLLKSSGRTIFLNLSNSHMFINQINMKKYISVLGKSSKITSYCRSVLNATDNTSYSKQSCLCFIYGTDQLYSTDNTKTHVYQTNVKNKVVIKGLLHDKKKKFAESKQSFLKDIRETKEKVKERMEEVIEKENVFTVPNLLCISRIAIAPYLGYLVLQSDYHLAVGIFAIAGFTDLIDGWIARTYPSQSSKFGSFLDPMADKVLIASLFLSLTYVGYIPIALTSLIIMRDLLLVGAGFYIRYQSLPPPKTLSRYFDATHATAQLAPTFISKVNTTIQLFLAASTLAAPVFNYVDHQLLQCLWYLTAGTTVASAISYILSRNTYRFLKPRK